MCFSATASFSAGIVLSAIGIASLKKVQEPSQIPFAGIPLIFAIQQICEGILWLALTDPEYAYLRQFSTYAFLFFAQVVWPIWVPFSIILLEKKEKRKNIAKLMVVIGGMVSIYLAYCLVSYNVEGNIIGHHIAYTQDYPKGLRYFGGLLYIISTITPPFFSGIKRMWSLGFAIFVSYIITIVFYEAYIVSVWCFFASIISLSVYAIMWLPHSSSAEEKAN